MHCEPHQSRHRFNRETAGKKIVISSVLAIMTLLLSQSWGRVAVSTSYSRAQAVSDQDLTIHHDARLPPDAAAVLAARRAAAGEAQSVAVNAAPGYYQTSDYLIGQVAVGLILPESDGRLEAQSEDWTAAEVQEVRTGVQKALNWWAGLEPAAHLSFSVTLHSRVAIGYGPS